MKVPTLTRDQADELLSNFFPLAHSMYPLIVFGIRGYFNPGNNKRGIYDDAIGYIASGDGYGVFPGNCDPSVQRAEIAVLQEGVWPYRKGLHGVHHLNPLPTDTSAQREDKARKLKMLQDTGKDIPGYTACYYALRQAGDVTVIRDGHKEPYTDKPPRPRMWIDIHRGGYNTTSSEGCQTIHPDYWDAFYWGGVEPLIRNTGPFQTDITPYCLVNAPVPIQ